MNYRRNIVLGTVAALTLFSAGCANLSCRSGSRTWSGGKVPADATPQEQQQACEENEPEKAPVIKLDPNMRIKRGDRIALVKSPLVS